MKKIISVILACVIAAACLSFVSCSKASIVGKWQGEFSAETMKKMAVADEDFPDIEFTGSVKFSFAFEEDGKYSFQMDGDSMADFWRENIGAMVDLTSKTAGVEISKEDFLSALNLADENEFAEYMRDSMTGPEQTGTYSYSNGVLTVDGEETRVELSSDKLVIVEVIKSAEGEETLDKSWLPLTLKKIG